MNDVPQLVTGEQMVSRGSQCDQRGGVFSETIVSLLGHGDFFEAARLGRLFMLASAVGATLSGQTNPLGAGGTPLSAIFNPVGSGYAAVILKAWCSMIAGATATPLVPVWNYIPPNAGVTAASGTAPTSLLLSGAKSNMNGYVGNAMTASAAATFLRPFAGSFSDPRHAGTTSETSAGVVVEETNGSIIVPPGAALIANTAPAGGVITGCIGFMWAEIPWPL